MNNISFFFMEGGGRETVYMYLRHVNLKFFYRATGLQLHVQHTQNLFQLFQQHLVYWQAKLQVKKIFPLLMINYSFYEI